MFTFKKEMPIVARPEVLVCGAGLAGSGGPGRGQDHGDRPHGIRRRYCGIFFYKLFTLQHENLQVDDYLVEVLQSKAYFIVNCLEKLLCKF